MNLSTLPNDLISFFDTFLCPAYDEDIFSILNEDHSFFLDDLEKKAQFETTLRSSTIEAVTIIQRNWRKYRGKRIFHYLHAKLYELSKENALMFLKRINSIEAQLFEKNKNRIVFRLAGETFPPIIVYKIFTNQHVLDLFNRSANSELEMKNKHDKKNWKICYVYKNMKSENLSLKIKYRFPLTHNNNPLTNRRKKIRDIKWIHEVYNI